MFLQAWSWYLTFSILVLMSTSGCMGRCWSRWILVRGKLYIYILVYLHLKLGFFFVNQIEPLMLLVFLGAGCIGWSSRYGKQRCLCWYSGFITFSNLPGTR
jgi:uncharacterized membrane protein YjjB (DUF3815 family)